MADIAAEFLAVVDDLREISRGIHPAILYEAGLRPALRALGRRSAVPPKIDVRIDGRLPEPVEVGAYYFVSEMLANAAKHTRASVSRCTRRFPAARSGCACVTTVSATPIRCGLGAGRAERPYRGAGREVLRAQPGGRRHHGVL
jgi:hypothetical protein